MANLDIRFEIPGEKSFQRRFENISHIPDNMRDAFEGMAEDFWTHERQVFADEGPGWRPLSPKYAKWKAKHYPGMPILVRTGALKASLTEFDADGAIYEVYNDHMLLGTDLKTKDGYTLGTLHQFGSKKVIDRPPKRPPVSVPMSLRTKWHHRLSDWLRDEIDYQG